MLALSDSTLRPAPAPTPTALVATRPRRNSFAGYPVVIQPPSMELHAGEIDPHVVFSKAWSGRSAAQVFAEQLGWTRKPSRSNTVPAPRTRPAPQAPISPPYGVSQPSVPSSYARPPSPPRSAGSAWAPPRPSTPGPNGPRPPSRGTTPVPSHAWVPPAGPPRPSSTYGSMGGGSGRSRPSVNFSQQSIYDQARAETDDGPPIIRPVAIRATRVQQVLQSNGSMHTTRLEASRTVNREGVVRDTYRQHRSVVVTVRVVEDIDRKAYALG